MTLIRVASRRPGGNWTLRRCGPRSVLSCCPIPGGDAAVEKKSSCEQERDKLPENGRAAMSSAPSTEYAVPESPRRPAGVSSESHALLGRGLVAIHGLVRGAQRVIGLAARR